MNELYGEITVEALFKLNHAQYVKFFERLNKAIDLLKSNGENYINFENRLNKLESKCMTGDEVSIDFNCMNSTEELEQLVYDMIPDNMYPKAQLDLAEDYLKKNRFEDCLHCLSTVSYFFHDKHSYDGLKFAYDLQYGDNIHPKGSLTKKKLGNLLEDFSSFYKNSPKKLKWITK